MYQVKKVFHLLLFGILISNLPTIMRAFIRTQTIHHDNGSFIKDFTIIRLADGETPQQPNKSERDQLISKSTSFKDVSYEYYTI